MEIGAAAPVYSEVANESLDVKLTRTLGSPVTILQGDPKSIVLNGKGLKLALYEKRGPWIQQAGLTIASYPEQSYRIGFTGGTIGIAITTVASIVDYTVGYDLIWGIRPFAAIASEAYTVTTYQGSSLIGTKLGESSVSQLSLGGGVGWDIDFAPSFGMTLQGSMMKATNCQDCTATSQNYSLGLRFGNW